MEQDQCASCLEIAVPALNLQNAVLFTVQLVMLRAAHISSGTYKTGLHVSILRM